MSEAQQKNQRFDEIDRSRGVSTLEEAGYSGMLNRAIEAIECGVRTNDLVCICQGQAILMDIKRLLILEKSFSQLGKVFTELGEAMARINCQEDRATGTTTNREESDRHDRVTL